ncbi:MAG: hypothetical protein CM15mP14_3580 [Rhodospirillaceae bacterium]|nr:MAG: hypothetical protein CM15mP14_3580 [Rhodospirillaceae bacterium]
MTVTEFKLLSVQVIINKIQFQAPHPETHPINSNSEDKTVSTVLYCYFGTIHASLHYCCGCSSLSSNRLQSALCQTSQTQRLIL